MFECYNMTMKTKNSGSANATEYQLFEYSEETDLEPDTTYSYIVQPISFTSIGDNVSPEYQVTATTLPADAALPIPFSDIAPDAWYADAVRYVSENGLMSGTSETTFGPDAETTRGMIVTILWRLEGTPAPASTPTFADVTNGQDSIIQML